MKPLQIDTHPAVEKKFMFYPESIRPKLLEFRTRILAVASQTEGIELVEESLKWGEPSYLVKKGSTIRIDWKPKKPDQIAIYFKCTSKLIPTFKEVFGPTFNYEGNRAIYFQLGENIAVEELNQCIKTAMTYHNVKHLPHLGLKRSAV